MYRDTARYYDKIYGHKDYIAEVEKIYDLVGEKSLPKDASLLDVACGTGKHLLHFSDRFRVEGLDLCPELLSVARERLPGVALHEADMTDFDLGRTFEVITCLFSAIGHLETNEQLDSAISRMAAHLAPGGTLVVEPWLSPEEYTPNTVHSLLIEEPDLRIARINTSLIEEGRWSVFALYHLIGTPTETKHIVEEHRLTLFTEEELRGAFERADLAVTIDREGLIGRGLYVGRAPK